MIIWQLILRNEIHETYLYVNVKKPIVYSGMFKTIVIFSQFQGRCSSFTQEQFMHIQILFWQIQVYLELWIIYARNVSHILTHVNKVIFLVKFIDKYLPTFRHISVDSRYSVSLHYWFKFK